MCYQCFGCGKCLPEEERKNLKPKCPACKAELEEGVKFCPKCGMYIRPKAGSLLVKKPKPAQKAEA